MKKIGFIGCGKMATAMIAAIVKSGIAKPSEIMAGDVDAGRLATARRRYGVRTSRDNGFVVRNSDIVFLAVKPQQMEGVLSGISPFTTGRHLVISIAAGTTVPFIRSMVPKARVVRVMPNMACAVSESMSAYAMGTGTSQADRRTVRKLLGAFGDSQELPEGLFHAVTALSGSGPAFLSYCLARMIEEAVRLGLDRGQALRLARQTMFGTAKLLLTEGMDPETLIADVASARGTTAAGLEVLEECGAGQILRKTIRAAAGRSRQLSRSACRRT